MKIDFWFDPICPWCWLTSRWVNVVTAERDLEVTWRPISLFLKNSPEPDDEYYEAILWTRNLLRVVEAVRAAGHEDRIGELYTRFGTHIHHEGNHDFHVADDLEALGLDPKLAGALDDDSFDTTIQAAMDDGLALTGQDVGTPLIAFDGTDGKRVGLFGPVISQVPTGDAALAAWDAFVTLAQTAGFWETKRDRSEGPQFDTVPPEVLA